MKNQKGKGSKLEDKVVDFLKELGVTYKLWKRIPWTGTVKEYDIYFPDTDAYLEIHGGFWHADPRLYPNREALCEVQRHNIKNDKLKAEIIESLGRPLHILWENDVHEEEQQTKKMLLEWGTVGGQ